MQLKYELLESECIADCLPAAERFHAIYEPGYAFDGDVFLRFWQSVFERGNGFIIVVRDDANAVVGGIGGVLCSFLTSNALNCVELFWWVNPELRGRVGLRLLTMFEETAKALGAARVTMAYMEDSMPQKVKKLYDLYGYKAYEHHMIKDL